MADSKETSTDNAVSENPNSITRLNSTSSTDDRSNGTTFTNLSQVDSDFTLARALQEQERAYMMLMMNGGDYAGSDGGSYEDEGELDGDAEEHYDEQQGSDYGEDAFDANESGINPEDFENDEAYARALQDAEVRDVNVRLMALAGLNDYNGNQDEHDQDAWRDVDPDELSYEDLIALGEAVGVENRGLSMDTIASLPSISYKAYIGEDCNSDQCVICRLDYEDGDSLVVLSCKHKYHTECINKWLQINKVCPICNTEVSTSCRPGPS